MSNDIVGLILLEDVLNLFPGSDREEITRLWEMTQEGIRTTGNGNNVEFIVVMLGATVPNGKGLADGAPLDGQQVEQRFRDVRDLVERRMKERSTPH